MTVDNMGQNEGLAQALGKLKTELSRVTGKFDGMDFARRFIGHEAQFADEILKLEASTAGAKGDVEDVEAMRSSEYQLAYLAGLVEARDLIREKIQVYPGDFERLGRVVIYRNTRNAARQEALQFVLDNHGDRKVITMELADRETTLAQLTDPADPQPAYAPTATPGMYARAYIATLKEALAVLEQA